MDQSILFLSWGCPWPPFGGRSLRTFSLLKEIAKAFPVEMIVLTRKPLSGEQIGELEKYSHSISQVPLLDTNLLYKLDALRGMVTFKLPYHSSILVRSLAAHTGIKDKIVNFPGIIFASASHWGTMVLDRPRGSASRWILDQLDADIDYWRVYASQVRDPGKRLLALINRRISEIHFRKIYPAVGQIISVCEEDRALTLAVTPQANIMVIENGVDCCYFSPNPGTSSGSSQLIFTGTSVPRNMTALRDFVRTVFPLIRNEIPEVMLLVGGNFSRKAQAEFKTHTNVRFTGPVDDMRPVYHSGDVFIAPFQESHGSKLKIAEAMAMALPIVSYPAGVRGFPLLDGESVLIGRNEKEFASQVVSLLRDSGLCTKLGNKARRVALETLDWSILGQRLTEMITSFQREKNNEKNYN